MKLVKGDEITGVIAPAWAVDANGNDVATRCEVNGNVPTQVVETTANAVFPVTAAPTASKRWYSATVYLDRNETEQIAAGIASCNAAIGAWKGLGGMVGLALNAIGGACVGLVPVAAGAAADDKCFRIDVHYTRSPWVLGIRGAESAD